MALPKREGRPTDQDLDELRRRAGARDVDADLVVLHGEGSQQKVPEEPGRPQEGVPPYAVWERPAAESVADAEGATYYDRPVLKQPTWVWTVPAYFFAGGAAGAAAILGGAAHLADRDGLDGLVRRTQWVAGIGAGVGSGLLIADLGRPGRFLNMLRVVRPSSPMNVGSWTLVSVASLVAGFAVMDRFRTPLRPVADALGLGAAVAGMPLTTYTGVLLANTAVPLWQQTRRSLPVLFAASAVTSAASILDLLPATERESRIIGRYGVAGRVAEVAAARLFDREAARVPRVGEPLHEGLSGALWRTSKLLNVAGLALSLIPTRHRAPRIAAAVAGVASGLAIRFAVMHAGRKSSLDPRATFRQQREGFGAAEIG